MGKRIAPRSKLVREFRKKFSKKGVSSLPVLPDPQVVRTAEEYFEIICQDCKVVRSDLKNQRSLRRFFEMALTGDTGESALANGRETLRLARGDFETILGDEGLAVKALQDVLSIKMKCVGAECPLTEDTLAFLKHTAGLSLE